MNLYRIEYSIKSSGQRIICHSVGLNPDDIVKDIVSVVGEISVLNICYLFDIHRISGSIRKQIIEDSRELKKTKVGRPKKYDWVEEKE